MSGLTTEITINIFPIVFFIFLLILAANFIFFAFQEKSQETKQLARMTDELKSEIETLKASGNGEGVKNAYLQFIYNLSHEVSNPLQSVQINLENMAECTPDEIGRWKQYYTIIKQEMRRLSALTGNLRLLSQLEGNKGFVKRELVNMRSVIENVMMTQTERALEKNITLQYQGPNRPARILGNRDHLYEVIMNLVDNGIKYSKDSGGEIIISLSEGDSHMRIMIADNGIGIPEEDLAFIFDTAYRSSNSLVVRRTGSGLGLAIVKRIINQHEGDIFATSILGEGATFTVVLPLYALESVTGESI